MPDNLNLRGPQDRNKINIHQEHEVKYWCNKFKINRNTLEMAVQAVGTAVVDVKTWLRVNHRGSENLF
ncbi:MAG: DUF3606 domain-containing protein [Bacteroidota bacterium]|nr:DUF3606 domain-containing protein [Bacteroidota bacterium]